MLILNLSADFESRVMKFMKGSYSKKCQDPNPCSFAYNVIYVDNKFTKPVVNSSGEIAAYGFVNVIIKEYEYCKKVIKNASTKI